MWVELEFSSLLTGNAQAAEITNSPSLIAKYTKAIEKMF